MDDWDSISNDTPPNGATDAWDTVSIPQRPPAPLRRPLPPDNLVIEGDAFQSTTLSGQNIPITPPSDASPPPQHIIAPTPSLPKRDEARRPTSRKPILLYVSMATLLIIVIVGLLLFKGFLQLPSLLATPPSYPHLSSTYQGTGHNITGNATGSLTLSSIIENQQGNISGLVRWGSPLCGSGYFIGTVSANDSIHFVSTTTDGSGCESKTIFTGTVNLQNNFMSGSYTTGSQSQIGTWQVSAKS
jgi:hypothetical protein